MPIKQLLILLVSLLQVACTSVNNNLSAIEDNLFNKQVDTALNEGTTTPNIHTQVENIARQLFDTAVEFDPEQPILVGTILPVKSMNLNQASMIGETPFQIQESFMTILSQAGLNVAEFRAMPRVEIVNDADILLSKDISKLSGKINAKYFLAGTYSYTGNTVMVNVRLLEIKSKRIIAAASGQLQNESIMASSKITKQNGQLIRRYY